MLEIEKKIEAVFLCTWLYGRNAGDQKLPVGCGLDADGEGEVPAPVHPAARVASFAGGLASHRLTLAE